MLVSLAETEKPIQRSSEERGNRTRSKYVELKGRQIFLSLVLKSEPPYSGTGCPGFPGNGKCSSRKRMTVCLFWLEQSTFCLIQGSFNKMSSAAPQGHNWTGPQPAAGEEGEDPVEQMISRTGCIAFHHAVMECMAEHHDWRKCQAQVKAFRDCVNQYQKNRLEELRRGQKPVPTDG
ncbi:uncharacterized protein LOC100013936 isoform X3 [Monodelphis domestica]|uniref:uncharacterized protein LOC100013936 isoform X3 n=1 Tax=Monodelphis domestica TaxID=13616 RepID=UPI0024E2425F|nr:uncharacterized protein LOC100013936 isoform X3 [Monodelphis domestica]